jgi:hypothetical protein
MAINAWDIAKNEPYQRALAGLQPYTQRQQQNFNAKPRDALGLLATATMGIPVLGDATGLLADANMYATQPESRGLLNYGMTLAGLLPLVPGVAGIKAISNTGEGVVDTAQTAYRGTHAAPSAGYGAPLHDMTKIMPADVYEPIGRRLYGLGDANIDGEVFAKLRLARNRPDMEVSVYRAVPKGVKDINPGDWVTTSKHYARNHGNSALDGNFDIVEKKIKAGELFSAGDPQEFGWVPPATSK